MAEDYAFAHRARTCGYKIWADTAIRLGHIGNYRYSWEDAGIEHPRFASFTLILPLVSPMEPDAAARLSHINCKRRRLRC